MKIINGRDISIKLLDEIKNRIQKESLKRKLCIIQIGNDEATNIYIKLKTQRAKDVGIDFEILKFEEDVTQSELEALVMQLNRDESVSGFFIQTPISKHLDLLKLTSLIDPKKDVDGMSPLSLGRLFNGLPCLVSATAMACLLALKSIPDFKLEGKHAAIINRSIILGKPLTGLLLNENCTVTNCHSKTQRLKEICKNADIIITATGKESFITKDFVREGSVLIDCGSPKPEVDKEVWNIDGFATPVPGGIGPLTIACLLKNLI